MNYIQYIFLYHRFFIIYPTAYVFFFFLNNIIRKFYNYTRILVQLMSIKNYNNFEQITKKCKSIFF